MVIRKIIGGRKRFVFDAEVLADYKVTAYNNAQDVHFSIFQDCRSVSG